MFGLSVFKHKEATPAGPRVDARTDACASVNSTSKQVSDRLDVAARGRPASYQPVLPLTTLGELAGYTSPSLAQDATGKRCVIKRNPAHVAGLVENERLMQKAYAIFGVAAPQGALIELENRPALVNPFISGTLYGELPEHARPAAMRALQKNFVVDALLGAWDVMGARGENVIVDKQGTPWRIDNGCGLQRRARGGFKDLSSEVGELASMRTGDSRWVSVATFSGVSNRDISRQIKKVLAQREAFMAILPTHLQKVMNKRLDYLQTWAENA